MERKTHLGWSESPEAELKVGVNHLWSGAWLVRTGKGKGVLSFLRSAFSALSSEAVEATYSTNNNLARS